MPIPSFPEFTPSRRPVVITDESGSVTHAGFTGETLVKSQAVIAAARALPATPTPLRKGALGPGSPRRAEVERAEVYRKASRMSPRSPLAESLPAMLKSIPAIDMLHARQSKRLGELERMAGRVGRILGRRV